MPARTRAIGKKYGRIDVLAQRLSGTAKAGSVAVKGNTAKGSWAATPRR